MDEAANRTIDHTAVFDTLRGLVGRWRGEDEDGHTALVTYSLTANDTALVEDWTFHTGGEALTIYHMDGDLLMAMHYCPIGNQPRLDLKEQQEDGRLMFECVSATHLKSFDDPHEHAFNLKLNADGSLHREETYVEDDAKLHSNGILFQRVA